MVGKEIMGYQKPLALELSSKVGIVGRSEEEGRKRGREEGGRGRRKKERGRKKEE